MTATALVGRDAELAELRAALGAAAGGAGGCVVVEGTAGIGKTRLLAEAGAAAREIGMAVAAGRATELDRVAPLAALLAALRASQPPVVDRGVMAQLGGMAGNRFWLLDRLGELVEGYTRARPLLIALDDVQWGDELTALALRMLVPVLRSSPVYWLLARRPVPARTPVQDAVEALIDDGAGRLRLGPLPEPAVAALATQLLHATPDDSVLALITRGGGNPFLVEELLSALRADGRVYVRGGRATAVAGSLPASFRAAVDGRLRDLSDDARRLLEAGAVLGRPFTVHEVAGLLGRSAVEVVEAAEEAVNSGALIDTSAELAFRHDLIREAVYRGLSGPVRRALHREAAEVLAAEGRPVAQSAQHLAHGARRGDRRAIDTLHDAAKELAPNAPGAAADLMLRLLDLTDEQGPSRPELQAEAIRLLALAGRVPEATRLGERALRPELDAPTEASIRLGLAWALKHGGEDAAVVEHTRRALTRRGVPKPQRAQLLAIQSHALLQVDDLELAGAAGAEAAELGKETGEHSAAVFGVVACSVVATARGDLNTAITLASDAVRTGDGVGGEARQRHPRLWLGLALVAADRFAEADAAYDIGEREAAELGSAWSTPLWHFFRAKLRLATGRLDDAAAEAEAGLRVAEQLGAMALASPLLAVLGRVALWRDDLGPAQDYLRRSQRLSAEQSQHLAKDLPWTTALYQDAVGQPHAALRTLAGTYPEVPERLVLLSQDPWAGPQLVRIAQRADMPAQAEKATAAARMLAERNPAVASLAGAAAHADGLHRGDLDALRRAVRAYQSSPRPLAWASALEDTAVAEHAAGHRNLAVELADQALGHYLEAGAVRDTARVQRRLRRLGVRRRPGAEVGRPATGWASLTSSELRVVRLVAEGLTNREVAGRLFLSPHTVDSHLRHAFTKLDISSRVELTRHVLAHAAAEDPVNT